MCMACTVRFDCFCHILYSDCRYISNAVAVSAYIFHKGIETFISLCDLLICVFVSVDTEKITCISLVEECISVAIGSKYHWKLVM